MHLGAHMSVAGGLSTAFDRAQSIGISTMQVFTKNQNRWEQKPAAPEEIARWFQAQTTTGIAPVVSHAAYLLNLGTPNDELWQKSINALIDELNACRAVGHPGRGAASRRAHGFRRGGRRRPHHRRAGSRPRGHRGLQNPHVDRDDGRAGHGAGLSLRAVAGDAGRRAGAGAGRLLLRHVPRLRRRLRHPHARNLRGHDGRFRPAGGDRAHQVLPLQRQQKGSRRSASTGTTPSARGCWG